MTPMEQMVQGIMTRLNLAGMLSASRGYYDTKAAQKDLNFCTAATGALRADSINQAWAAGKDVSQMLAVHSTLETGIMPSSAYLNPALGQQQVQSAPLTADTLTGAIQEANKDTMKALKSEVISSEKRIKSYMDTNFQRKKGRKP